jgi:serine protease inhibitor ecotin
MLKLMLAFCTLLVGSHAMAQQSAQDNLKAYPAPTDGMKRLVVYLEPKEEEEDYRVELMVGKTVEVDASNRFFFAGSLEEETIEGWGFPGTSSSRLGPWQGPASASIPMPRKSNALCGWGANQSFSDTTANFLWWSTSRRTPKSGCVYGLLPRNP